jgi:L-ascorbate metabolism protein UlaG (beta-lactamase superfamily)
VKLKSLGHAGFEILLDGKTIVVDPFITKRDGAALTLNEVSKADIVAVTHSHFDHTGDAIELALRDHADFISTHEVCEEARNKGIEEATSPNIGGSVVVRGIKIVCTLAFHSGNPCGFVFIGKEGSVYHAGDTGLFGDMALIGELYSPSAALLPIGGYFTMGPIEAAKAAELLHAKYVVPMHFNTFPPIRQDPEEFKRLVKARTDSKVIVLKEGESVELRG